MTYPTQPKPNPLPAILVYGTPTDPALTQASWFRAEDKEAVKAAAEALKLSVIELQTDADKALAAGAHEGVLKGNGGRLIVGSVSSEVYRRIEEHVRKGAGAPDPSRPEIAAAATTKARGRTKHEHHRRGCDLPWTLSCNSRRTGDCQAGQRDRSRDPSGRRQVLAAYWNEKREFEGFWLATVKRIEPGEFTLEWFDSPEFPAFKSRPQDVAVPHPEFRVTGK